jgi:hypothetical protein
MMQYVGSLYASDIPSSEYKKLAILQLELPGPPSSGFNVQALVIAAIATHSEDEFERGRTILDRAIYMALEIRMNFSTFANSEEDPVLAESWRRTWWGLYVADGGFATTSYPSTFMYVCMISIGLLDSHHRII